MAAVASKKPERGVGGGGMKGRLGVFIVPVRPVRSNQQGVTYSLGARCSSTAPPPIHSRLSPSQTVWGSGGEYPP